MSDNDDAECIIEMGASRIKGSTSMDSGSLGLWKSNTNGLHFLKWVSNSNPHDVEHTLVTHETVIKSVDNLNLIAGSDNSTVITIPGIIPPIAINEADSDAYVSVLTSAIAEIPVTQPVLLPLSSVVSGKLLSSLNEDNIAIEELKTLLPKEFANTESVKRILSSFRLQETGRHLSEVLYNSSEIYSLFSAIGLDPRILIEPSNLNGCYNNDATLKFIQALERLHKC